jgi:energy-coupling factor transporter transmembrane protein EcfT
MIEENKEEKKKHGLVKRIFKRIGLSLLTLLLILALIYHAPWKIITLLAIILAVCTVLPKPARKWFWLSVGAVVLILIIWIFLPENNEGWQPYKYNFNKELKELVTKYSIQPEENAATIYNQLMERYDANDYYIFDLVDSDTDTWDKIFRNPWRSEDYPEIADRLKHIQGAIETLIEISGIKQCAFPISDPLNSESQSNRNSAVRRWARLLVIAINNDIAEGRIDKAIQKFATILQMARHQYQQPVTMDVLVGIGIESLAIQQFNRYVVESEALDKYLNIIENALPDSKNDWNSIFAKTIEYDKLCAKIELAHYYEVNAKGKTRLSRDPLAQLRTNLSEFLKNTEIDNDQTKAALEYIAYPSYLQKKLIKAETILRWFTMPSDREKAAEILEMCFERYYAMAQPDFDWTKQPQKIESLFTRRNFCLLRLNYKHFAKLIADMSEEGFYSTHALYLRNLTLIRGSRLLIAIKQYKIEHGSWPPNLDAIKSAAPAEAFIDPVTGNQLEYENHGERFSLYGETANIWPK